MGVIESRENSGSRIGHARDGGSHMMGMVMMVVVMRSSRVGVGGGCRGVVIRRLVLQRER